MNCLLLLIILFCCNSNGNCGSGNCRRENSCERNHNMRTERSVGNCNTENRRIVTSNVENCVVREEEHERLSDRNDCGYDTASRMHTHIPPKTSRTKFPYLDVEPRTCGCEEKSEN